MHLLCPSPELECGGNEGNYTLELIDGPIEGLCPDNVCDENQDINNDGCDVDPPMFGSITSDESICGTLSRNDRDWYKFTVEAGGSEVVATLSVVRDVNLEGLGLVSGVNDCSVNTIDSDIGGDGNGNYSLCSA